MYNQRRWIRREKRSKSRLQERIHTDIKKGIEITASKGIKKSLDVIEKEFTKACPRCAGEFKDHWIRCGPEKLVHVNKCVICNFWLPVNT